MSTVTPLAESEILNRLIKPESPTLSVSAAQAVLAIEFDEEDRKRMRELAQKAREGSLTGAEQEEIAVYERIGSFLGLLQSKARFSLRAAGLEP